MAHVFISHSNGDTTWPADIHGWLTDAGHTVYLDQHKDDGNAIGDDWEQRIYNQLRQADAVICVLSPAYVKSVWCAAEIGAARSLGSEVLPVRVAPLADHFTLLKSIQILDAVNDPESAKASLLSRLTVIDGGGGWGWKDGRPPYPGLRSFELDEHRVFFGRSREITSIAERLRSPEREQPAILTVVGPSGCGKSSLVRAGVVPRIAGEGYWLLAPPIVPGADPLSNLVRALVELVQTQGIPIDVSTLRDGIDREGLKSVAARLLVAARAGVMRKLLIVIDQFEELLTQTKPTELAEFVSALAPALGGPVQVLATLRPEFLDQVSKNAELARLGTLHIHQVRPLDSNSLVAVIQQPATVAGLSLEDGLVARLIADTATGEALPLLAFTLEQLAHGLTRGGRLTHRRYDDIGGVQGALRRQADEALNQAREATGLTDDQVIAELLNLVTVDEQGRPSRRRLVIDDASAATTGAMGPFLERRLLSTEAIGNTTLISVSHDSFLANWPPLKKEIDEHVIALRARRMVEADARDWAATGRDSAGLLQDQRLAKALVETGAEFTAVSLDARNRFNVPGFRSAKGLTTRVDLDDNAQEFLRASINADRARRSKTKRKTLAIMAVLLLAALSSFGLFVNARDERNRANASEREAIAQRLVAEAQNDLNNAADKSALQQLLAGRQLMDEAQDSQFYPVVVKSASTYKILENPVGPENALVPVQSVAISRNGAGIAAGNNDHTVRLWDAESGELDREIRPQGSGTVWSVAFDPDGARIAVGSQDGVLQVVDARTGQRISAMMDHNDAAVMSVAFSSDGRSIATGDSEGTVRVWDVTRGGAIFVKPADTPGPLVRSVAFSPNGELLASSSNDGGIRLWDAHTGAPLGDWGRGGKAIVLTTAFNYAGDRLALGDSNGMVTILEIVDGHVLRYQEGSNFSASPTRVNSLAFSSDGSRIVTGGDETAVKVWDAHRPFAALGHAFAGHTNYVTSVSFSRDGTRIVSGSVDGSVREWNAVYGLAIQAGQGDAIRAVGFSPDGYTLASGGSDGTVKLWNTQTAAFIVQLARKAPIAENDKLVKKPQAINGLAFNRDGSRVVTASSDGFVSVWDTTTGALVKDLAKIDPPGGPPIPGEDRMMTVAFDSNGRRIAAGGFDGVVRLWDAQTLTPIGVMRAQLNDVQGQDVPYGIWSVAFSPDGRRLATGSGFDITRRPNNLIQLWNLDTLAPEGDPIRGQTDTTIYTVAFDHTGEHIISGNSDGTVCVWSIATHQLDPKPLFNDQNPIYSLAPAHKGDWIATGGGGGVVRVWDMQDKPPVETALEGHHNWVHSVAVSLDDTLIASGSADGSLQLWPGPGDVGAIICSKLTSNASPEQWEQWVGDKVPYRESCEQLSTTRDVALPAALR